MARSVARRIGIAAAAVVVALAAIVALQPERFRIERSALVHAPAEVVFALIDDFHQWSRWSPYEKRDPDMVRTFEGSVTGPGAVYAWDGNGDVGKGRMTILRSEPGELVAIELQFFEPMAATNQARFELTPGEGGTWVRWSMEGSNGFLGKAISLVIDMDAMVGRDFEQGLADLDAAARADTQRLGRADPAGHRSSFP